MSRFAGQSKFFGGGASSSESDSESEDAQETRAEAAKLQTRSKYMMGSDNEDEEERVIKSGATKRAEALDKILDNLRKHSNINDFNALDGDLTSLELEVKRCEE